MADHIFTRKEVKELLDNAVGKTLGEVDVNNVFQRAIDNPKITGIAGDVIEQSVFGYPADTKVDPDLEIDGKLVELKTTGLKKSGPRDKSGHALQAKEGLTITAVSKDKIIDEDFNNSQFWNKLREVLLVYYLYNSDKTVPAIEYRNFPIQGYQFHNFSEEDREILEKDWLLVKKFVQDVKSKGLSKEDEQEAMLDITKLRDKLTFFDLAPKKSPRFRLLKPVVTSIVREHFGLEFKPLLPENNFTNLDQLKQILHRLSEKYRGKTISEIAEELKIDLPRSKSGTVTKNSSNLIIANMFSDKAQDLSELELFEKFSIYYKTVVQTKEAKRTEDTKFLKVDFDEWSDSQIEFEDSFIYEFFATQKFLFAVFEEQKKNDKYENNKFLGFKLHTFSDEFIYNEVKRTWMRVRELVNEGKLVIEEIYNKDGSPRMNKTGIQQEAPNLPKSKNFDIFLRGTSSDSTQKSLTINGMKVYYQNFWIKGSKLIEILNEVDFL